MAVGNIRDSRGCDQMAFLPVSLPLALNSEQVAFDGGYRSPNPGGWRTHNT
jgi:hypothetical protein